MKDGRTFNCGTGFSDEERKRIWDSQDNYLEAMASVKYMATGLKDGMVRHPTFLGFRHKDDINNDY